MRLEGRCRGGALRFALSGAFLKAGQSGPSRRGVGQCRWSRARVRHQDPGDRTLGNGRAGSFGRTRRRHDARAQRDAAAPSVFSDHDRSPARSPRRGTRSRVCGRGKRGGFCKPEYPSARLQVRNAGFKPVDGRLIHLLRSEDRTAYSFGLCCYGLKTALHTLSDFNRSPILNPQSTILNPQSPILNPRSPIPNPQSTILNPQSSIRTPLAYLLLHRHAEHFLD